MFAGCKSSLLSTDLLSQVQAGILEEKNSRFSHSLLFIGGFSQFVRELQQRQHGWKKEGP